MILLYFKVANAKHVLENEHFTKEIEDSRERWHFLKTVEKEENTRKEHFLLSQHCYTKTTKKRGYTVLPLSVLPSFCP